MATIQSTTLLGRKAIDFVKEELFNEQLIRNFLSYSFEGKLNLIEGFLIGHETERFAAEPVYAVKGVGKLISQGVEGLKNKIKIQDYLNSYEGLMKVASFIEEVEAIVQEKA